LDPSQRREAGKALRKVAETFADAPNHSTRFLGREAHVEPIAGT
jgi:hypothetical protein